MERDNPYLVSLLKRFHSLHTGSLEGLEGVSRSAEPVAVVSTMDSHGLDTIECLLVMADGTILACSKHSIMVRVPSNFRIPFAVFVGNDDCPGYVDGRGPRSQFWEPMGMAMTREGNMVVADCSNNALRLVSEEGNVSLFAGAKETDVLRPGFKDGTGGDARFHGPYGVVMTASGECVVTDVYNHAVRVVASDGTVRTLAGNGHEGFEDGQGASARFNCPLGLALDVDGSVLVADSGNHAVRRVTMEGVVSTVAGSGESGYADGEGAAARFNTPTDVVVDENGAIVVADKKNNRLRTISGRHVATLAGDGEDRRVDGNGTKASFGGPVLLALDERGRLLVVDDTTYRAVRVVDAGLAPPAWMGPALQKRLSQQCVLAAQKRILQDDIHPDVVVVVRGRPFNLHQAVLSSRSEYFKGLFSSRWAREHRSADGLMKYTVQIAEACSDEKVREAFAMLTRYMYYGDLAVLRCAEGELGAAIGILVGYLQITSLTHAFVAYDSDSEEH